MNKSDQYIYQIHHFGSFYDVRWFPSHFCQPIPPHWAWWQSSAIHMPRRQRAPSVRHLGQIEKISDRLQGLQLMGYPKILEHLVGKMMFFHVFFSCFFSWTCQNHPQTTSEMWEQTWKNTVNPPIFGLQCSIINWSDGWHGTFFRSSGESGLPVRLIFEACPHRPSVYSAGQSHSDRKDGTKLGWT